MWSSVNSSLVSQERSHGQCIYWCRVFCSQWLCATGRSWIGIRGRPPSNSEKTQSFQETKEHLFHPLGRVHSVRVKGHSASMKKDPSPLGKTVECGGGLSLVSSYFRCFCYSPFCPPEGGCTDKSRPSCSPSSRRSPVCSVWRSGSFPYRWNVAATPRHCSLCRLILFGSSIFASGFPT